MVHGLVKQRLFTNIIVVIYLVPTHIISLLIRIEPDRGCYAVYNNNVSITARYPDCLKTWKAELLSGVTDTERAPDFHVFRGDMSMHLRDTFIQALSRTPPSIKEPLKSILNQYFDIQRRIFNREQKYLLVLGHMRSGSTLLAHILMSNPEILGQAERNVPYRTRKDLDLLVAQAHYYSLRLKWSDCYVMDQINHGKLILDESLLYEPGLYRIFLIREPRASITSMLCRFGPRWGWNLEDAVFYYTRRLEELSRYAQLVPNKESSVFLTYHDLTENTRASFARIENMLRLKNRLKHTYRTHEFTGSRRGDKSENIRFGKIIRKNRELIELDEKTINYLSDAYYKCTRVLSENCVQ